MITLFGRYQGLATATIIIRWGTGSTLADYTTIFTGHVLVPGGKTWEEDRVTLHLASSAQRANKLATAAANADGIAYPRLFGDYTEAPQQWLPATALSARSHLLAHPDDLRRVAQVRQVNGTAITGWTLDATTGIITVPTDQEAIEVLAEGTQYDSSWKMDALCRWLLGEVAGVADASLDLPTWTALTADVETDVRGRCYLQPQQAEKVLDLLIIALDEVFYDLVITTDDQYRAVSRVPPSLADVVQIRPTDIANDTGGRRKVSLRYDQDRLLANTLFMRFARAPRTGQTILERRVSSALAQSAIGFEAERTLTSRFLYTTAGVDFWAMRSLKIYGRELQQPKIVLQGVHDMNPGDQRRISWGPFRGQPVQVRAIQRRPDSNEMSIDCFATNPLVVRSWCPDTSLPYAMADSVERFECGFWTDDSGLVDGQDIGSTWGDG